MHEDDPHELRRGHADADLRARSGSATREQVEEVFAQFGESHPPVAFIVASREEYMTAENAAGELTTRGIDHHIHELSPTRSPEVLDTFLSNAGLRGVRVIIATGGEVPWLPSMVASRTELPVIGVPMETNMAGGLDTLMATAQAPAGMPVACMGIGNVRNAAIFAARILGAAPLPPQG